jgi:hypothetical protein
LRDRKLEGTDHDENLTRPYAIGILPGYKQLKEKYLLLKVEEIMEEV